MRNAFGRVLVLIDEGVQLAGELIATCGEKRGTLRHQTVTRIPDIDRSRDNQREQRRGDEQYREFGAQRPIHETAQSLHSL
jgi:hypothetical protein